MSTFEESVEAENKRIEEWMKNPVIPAWLVPLVKTPASPNTISYDKDAEKIVYTIVATGETILFDTLEEAHDSPDVDTRNVELVGIIPGVDDEMFISVPSERGTRRMLFFNTKKRSYQNFLYMLYMCHAREESYEANPKNFQIAQSFVENHMVSWGADSVKEFNEYGFNDDHNSISKKPVFFDKSHVWQASTTVKANESDEVRTHTGEGTTIEEAIVKLAKEVHDTYTVEGVLRK